MGIFFPSSGGRRGGGGSCQNIIIIELFLQVNFSLSQLSELTGQYEMVSNKTTELHVACQDLLQVDNTDTYLCPNFVTSAKDRLRVVVLLLGG